MGERDERERAREERMKVVREEKKRRYREESERQIQIDIQS